MKYTWIWREYEPFLTMRSKSTALHFCVLELFQQGVRYFYHWGKVNFKMLVFIGIRESKADFRERWNQAWMFRLVKNSWYLYSAQNGENRPQELFQEGVQSGITKNLKFSALNRTGLLRRACAGFPAPCAGYPPPCGPCAGPPPMLNQKPEFWYVNAYTVHCMIILGCTCSALTADRIL